MFKTFVNIFNCNIAIYTECLFKILKINNQAKVMQKTDGKILSNRDLNIQKIDSINSSK